MARALITNPWRQVGTDGIGGVVLTNEVLVAGLTPPDDIAILHVQVTYSGQAANTWRADVKTAITNAATAKGYTLTDIQDGLQGKL